MTTGHAALFFGLLLSICIGSPRHSAGTACADFGGNILGEVSCAGASKVIVTKDSAIAEVTRDDAGEFIEACQKVYKEQVTQVGKKIFDSFADFVPYTVVMNSSRVSLDSAAALDRFKKQPPPPRVLRKKNAGIATNASVGFAIVVLLIGIFI
jgi:hypothetical protein